MSLNDLDSLLCVRRLWWQRCVTQGQ